MQGNLNTCLDFGQCTAGATALPPLQAAWELQLLCGQGLGFISLRQQLHQHNYTAPVPAPRKMCHQSQHHHVLEHINVN